MALVGRNQTNAVRFCWEQVLRTNPLFRISTAFAPAGHGAQLLPLYALFGVVEEICSEHSDEDLARRKLDWWRQECGRLGSQGSEHPILRELVASGAYAALRKDSLAQLFDDAESRLDPEAPASLDQLQALCRNLSLPQFELELSLWGMDQPLPQALESAAAANGLAQLLREAARRRPPADYWWLPLTLLARHGISRADIGHNGEPSVAARAAFADLFDGCREWKPARGPGGLASESNPAALRHLCVIGELQLSAVRRLQPDRPGQFAAELTRLGLPQLYRAWQAARSIALARPV